MPGAPFAAFSWPEKFRPSSHFGNPIFRTSALHLWNTKDRFQSLSLHTAVKEDGVSAVFAENGLRYPVPISDEREYSWIKPSDWLRTLGATGDMDKLLAGFRTMDEAQHLLGEFWGRWRLIYPQHEVFTSGRNLLQCIPIYIHGDEGVTYKKNGVLLVSLQAPFGSGSKRSPYERDDDRLLENNLSAAGTPMNLLKSALRSRLLSVICPKDPLYSTKQIC